MDLINSKQAMEPLAISGQGPLCGFNNIALVKNTTNYYLTTLGGVAEMDASATYNMRNLFTQMTTPNSFSFNNNRKMLAVDPQSTGSYQAEAGRVVNACIMPSGNLYILPPNLLDTSTAASYWGVKGNPANTIINLSPLNYLMLIAQENNDQPQSTETAKPLTLHLVWVKTGFKPISISQVSTSTGNINYVSIDRLAAGAGYFVPGMNDMFVFVGGPNKGTSMSISQFKTWITNAPQRDLMTLGFYVNGDYTTVRPMIPFGDSGNEIFPFVTRLMFDYYGWEYDSSNPILPLVPVIPYNNDYSVEPFRYFLVAYLNRDNVLSIKNQYNILGLSPGVSNPSNYDLDYNTNAMVQPLTGENATVYIDRAKALSVSKPGAIIFYDFDYKYP
jgi:hypothetical protein